MRTRERAIRHLDRVRARTRPTHVAGSFFALALVLGIIASAGIWSTWYVVAGDSMERVDWRLDAIESRDGESGAFIEAQEYGEESSGVGPMFASVATLTRLAIFASAVAATMSVLVAIRGMDAPRGRLLSRIALGAGGFAAVIYAYAPMVVAASMPRAILAEGYSFSAPSPATSFWGRIPDMSWGAQYAWFLSLIAASLALVAVILLARETRRSGLAAPPTPR